MVQYTHQIQQVVGRCGSDYPSAISLLFHVRITAPGPGLCGARSLIGCWLRRMALIGQSS